jgi:biopolymer transport protein ExbB
MAIMKGIEFLIKGGPVMWPLFVCAILAVAVMIERFIAITKASADNEELLDQVKLLLSQGKVADAGRLAEQSTGPVASLVAAGIRSRNLDSDAIERTMEELALRETPMLYKRLGILDTIITIAPLLGLLGTVTGMIKSFHVVGTAGLNNSFGITSGVAEALIATATGLAIAIVTLIGYNYLTEKVKEVIAEMEIRATQLMNILANQRTIEGRPSNEVASSRA